MRISYFNSIFFVSFFFLMLRIKIDLNKKDNVGIKVIRLNHQLIVIIPINKYR